MRRRKIITAGLSLLLVGVVAGMELSTLMPGRTHDPLQKLEQAFLVVTERYVEEVDEVALSESAIRGMVKELDPHSVYVSADQMRRVEEEFSGSFEGIGISYEFVDGPEEEDTIAVLSVIPGGPSDEAGLMSGDRIVAVGDSSAVGFSHDDVQRTLKGPRGTTVDVTVHRPGYGRPLEFSITRDRIPLYSIDVAYMVDEETGYIKVNRFARTTYSEFLSALRELRADGIQRLVLDLRDNAGGYMQMAVRISDEFLKEGQLIVSERSRLPEHNKAYHAEGGGQFEEQPVIVLVNEHSASASEIVAGALQDHDRGLIVGRRTFGKGLVQEQIQLDDGSALRITVARYYTPAGRLIQTPYAEGEQEAYYAAKRALRKQTATLSAQEILEQVPDSLTYTTDGGRTVVGGGGILPDVIVRSDSLSSLLKAVLGNNLDNAFVRHWFDVHGEALRAEWEGRKEAFLRSFDVGDPLFQEFVHFLEERGYAFVPQADGADPDGQQFSVATLEADRNVLATRLKARLAVRLFDYRTFYPALHPVDDVFREAMARWPSARELAAHYAERP